jgi:hypothetical protein
MQAARLLLHQYGLLHLQVYLLQAKEDLAFLQCSAKMMELFRPGTRGTRTGNDVPLDSLNLDVFGITFCVCLPKRMCESHQSILPHEDGAFHAIQPPLSGKELLLQLNGHR